MRIPFIAGNWKMNMTCQSGIKLVEAISEGMGDTDVEVAVCCPATLLHSIHDALKHTDIKLGAQNMHWEDSGAFTGEISADMLKEAGVSYVILGHSERRQIFGETDDQIHMKLKKAFQKLLTPILCIGETLEEREAERMNEVLETQLQKNTETVTPEEAAKMVVAYEPIWAIGTGKTATPGQAAEAIGFIRKWLSSKYGDTISEQIRILYGGSVKPENTTEIMESEDIDGALVGGASLKAEDFIGIINF